MHRANVSITEDDEKEEEQLLKNAMRNCNYPDWTIDYKGRLMKPKTLKKR